MYLLVFVCIVVIFIYIFIIFGFSSIRMGGMTFVCIVVIVGHRYFLSNSGTYVIGAIIYIYISWGLFGFHQAYHFFDAPVYLTLHCAPPPPRSRSMKVDLLVDAKSAKTWYDAK